MMQIIQKKKEEYSQKNKLTLDDNSNVSQSTYYYAVQKKMYAC